MESTYSRAPVRRRSGVTGRKKGVTLGGRERRRLVQLGVCVALFLAVFLGRGIFPEKLDAIREDVLSTLHADTDFVAAFFNLGRSIGQGEPVADTLGELWVDVFAGGPVTTTWARLPSHTAQYHQELAYLISRPDAGEMLRRRGEAASFPAFPQKAEPLPEETQPPAEDPTSHPDGALLPPEPMPVYTGPAMPDNATMEKLPLGLEATASPVIAVVSSGYGWREHPIEGGEKFHAGADLAAPYGDPIGAFADGVVDYIGESPAYGQYLQIKHADGVTSFYAHCSKLCVQPGQTVTAGEKVAEVGDTGEVTGAHLHFELKRNGELLNPLYYIETE